MAPALTEPLSPKEKLSTSAATASPVKTRSSRNLGNSSSVKTKGTTLKRRTPRSISKERNNLNKPTCATRSTRSKETKHIKALSSAKTKSKENTKNNNNIIKKLSDEQMGLSAARNNTEIRISTTDQKKNKAALKSCKDSTTQQLLADLTDNFEEAITAELYLRQQLPEVNISKGLTNNNETKADNISLGKVSSAENTVVQHMESRFVDENVQEKKLVSNELKQEEDKTVTASTHNKSPNNKVHQQNLDQPTCSSQSAVPTVSNSILSVSNTDTTMPMPISQIEDNLDERLNQLDENLTSRSCGELNNTVKEETAITHSTTEQKIPDKLGIIHTQPQQSPIASSLNNVNLSQNFLKEGTVVPVPTGDELGDQDIEEMLKALKGLENVPTGTTDTLCDLNSLFNEVFTQANNFEDNNATQQGVAETSVVTVKESSKKDLHAEAKETQQILVEKLSDLLQRTRKLQARHMCRHTSTEIAGLFEWTARVSSKVIHPVRSPYMSEQDAAVMAVVSGRPPNRFWQEQKRNPVPASAMSMMLRQIETAAEEQQTSLSNTNRNNTTLNNTCSPLLPKRIKKHLQDASTTTTASGGIIGSNMGNQTTNVNEMLKSDAVVPNFDSYVSSELLHTSSLMHTELRELQNAIDSDATESSSGGESADEMVNYNNQTQKPLSISKRAVWRYSRDRGAIALRWSWLISQVNDLEVKIRQHNDLHAEMNRSKGEIILESPQKNEPECTDSSMSNTNAAEIKDSCCRTKALSIKDFRKRKLFQTTNMHTVSKKAARPSNIKCGCQWPQQPCALCNGRTDATAPRDLPSTMMLPNRIALLDHGYHPMLSFTEDIVQSIHIESTARQPDWQFRVMRSQAKSIAKSVWKAEREVAVASSKRHGDTIKRRYVRRKDRSNNAAASADKVSCNNRGVNNGTASTTTPTTPLVANSKLLVGQEAETSAMPAYVVSAAVRRLSSNAHEQLSSAKKSTTTQQQQQQPYDLQQQH